MTFRSDQTLHELQSKLLKGGYTQGSAKMLINGDTASLEYSSHVDLASLGFRISWSLGSLFVQPA